MLLVLAVAFGALIRLIERRAVRPAGRHPRRAGCDGAIGGRAGGLIVGRGCFMSLSVPLSPKRGGIADFAAHPKGLPSTDNRAAQRGFLPL